MNAPNSDVHEKSVFGGNKDNIWAREPERDEKGEAISAGIDKQLKEDRIDKIRKCSILVLGPHPPPTIPGMAAGEGRISLLTRLAKLEGSNFNEDDDGRSSLYLPKGDDDQSVFVLSTYSTPQKDKITSLRLSSEDPAVLIYVVDLFALNSPPEKVLGKRLLGFLKHFHFVCRTVSELKETTVCLLLCNCIELQNALAALGKDVKELKEAFPTLKDNASPQDALDAIAEEFRATAEEFKPHSIKMIRVDTSLQTRRDSESSEGIVQADDVSQMIIDLASKVQEERLRKIHDKSMKSEIFADKIKNEVSEEVNKEPNVQEIPDKSTICIQITLFIIAILGLAASIYARDNPKEVREYAKLILSYVSKDEGL